MRCVNYRHIRQTNVLMLESKLILSRPLTRFRRCRLQWSYGWFSRWFIDWIPSYEHARENYDWGWNACGADFGWWDWFSWAQEMFDEQMVWQQSVNSWGCWHVNGAVDEWGEEREGRGKRGRGENLSGKWDQAARHQPSLHVEGSRWRGESDAGERLHESIDPPVHPPGLALGLLPIRSACTFVLIMEQCHERSFRIEVSKPCIDSFALLLQRAITDECVASGAERSALPAMCSLHNCRLLTSGLTVIDSNFHQPLATSLFIRWCYRFQCESQTCRSFRETWSIILPSLSVSTSARG